MLNFIKFISFSFPSTVMKLKGDMLNKQAPRLYIQLSGESHLNCPRPLQGDNPSGDLQTQHKSIEHHIKARLETPLSTAVQYFCLSCAEMLGH